VRSHNVVLAAVRQKASTRILAPLLFYGVVSARTEKVVEFFLERDAAEAIILEVQIVFGASLNSR